MRHLAHLFDRMEPVIRSLGDRVNGPEARPTQGVDMANDTHILYRFFDKDDVLLYVGITNNPKNRFKGHQKEKSWFNKVTHSTMEHFGSRNELEDAEVRAIQTEKPKYNVVHTVQAVLKPELVRLRALRSHSRRISYARGADANSFPAPDGFVDEAPQLAKEIYPCLVCVRFGVVREIDESGIPLNDIVRCVACRTEWTSAEWVEAVVERYRRPA